MYGEIPVGGDGATSSKVSVDNIRKPVNSPYPNQKSENQQRFLSGAIVLSFGKLAVAELKVAVLIAPSLPEAKRAKLVPL